MLFMERQGVLIARSVRSISAGKERSLVRILNPSQALVTVHQNEKLRVLQPLEAALESATIEETEPKSSRGEVEKALRQLQAQTQGLSEAESAALEALLLISSPSRATIWAKTALYATTSTLEGPRQSSKCLRGYHTTSRS